MSLYNQHWKIDGVPAAFIARGEGNGRYQVLFEREQAELPAIEAIEWDHPSVEHLVDRDDLALPEGYGFEVVDLGIDVKPADIVKTAKEQNINIIGLSGVLTLAIDAMKATVEAFKEAGMWDQVHIIIGGAPVSADVCKLVGADAWAVNPADTIKTCRGWAKEG